MDKKDIFITGITKKTGIPSSIIKKIVLNCCREINHHLKELSISYVTTAEMIELNTKYLGHQYSTDILTFDLSEHNDGSEGEIIISPEAAESNATRFKVTKENENARLIIHGLLHLHGFGDSTPAEKRVMRNKENNILKKVFADE